MSLQALLGVVRHLVIERIGVDVNILLISQVALPCGDAETASGGTQQHQNASSEASSRYSHSMNRKCGHFHVVSYFIRKTNVAIHGDTQRHKSETKLL